MAYFRENENDETRQQSMDFSGTGSLKSGQEYVESDYDDGFDDPEEIEEEILTEEEQKEIREKRLRMLYSAGDLTAVIAGTVVILLLLAFLMNMIGFLMNDADRTFTLFQMRF